MKWGPSQYKDTFYQCGISILKITTVSSLWWNSHTWKYGLYIQTGPRGLVWYSKISSYQYRKSHCGDKTILRPSYRHNGISYTGKISLYWIRALVAPNVCRKCLVIFQLKMGLQWDQISVEFELRCSRRQWMVPGTKHMKVIWFIPNQYPGTGFKLIKGLERSGMAYM